MNFIVRILPVSQPDGLSCGPTCISMASSVASHEVSVNAAKIACKTNAEVGTTADMLVDGMKKLGIPFSVGRAKDTTGLLADIEGGKNVAIVRTLAYGVKHWILVVGHADGKFVVNDPWLGRIKYSHTDLDDIWKPRDYFYVTVPVNKSPA